MSADSITKKRKMEDDAPDVTVEAIVEMISIWDTTQLVKVLSELASRSTWALDAIKEENNKSVKLRKVFVRNLSFQSTDETLAGYFSQFGSVIEAVVIRNKSDNKSKGFGFVTFETTDGAAAALKEPEKQIDDRTAYVNLAAKRSAEQKNGMGAGSGAQSNTGSSPLTKLFVRSLSYDTTQLQMEQFFCQYGQVSEAVVLTNKDGTSKGYGFVTFSDVESANRALVESTKNIGGRDVYVKLAAANDGHASRSNQQKQWGNNNQQQQQMQMMQQQRMMGMQQQQQLMNMMMSAQGGMGAGGMGAGSQANAYGATDFSAQQQQPQGNMYQQQW